MLGRFWGRSLLWSFAFRVVVWLRRWFGKERREGEGELWDEVLGDVGGGEAWSGGLDAADVGAFDVEAVAEEAEHFFDVLFEWADDVFAEESPVAAVLSFEAPGGLGLVEEAADFVDEWAEEGRVGIGMGRFQRVDRILIYEMDFRRWLG